jgi:NADH dehydrogenase
MAAHEAIERIFVTGGTGFVGERVLQALAGRKVRLLVRDRAKHAQLASADVELVEGDVTHPESLRGALDGCSVVINLVAIIEESRDATFDRVIRHGTENVVAEARRIGGIRRFVQMSALGATNNPHFPYFHAKWLAEQAVQASGLVWTIFRPSIIFGPGDGFINVLADLVRKAPVVPVVGNGRTKFMPLSVDEVGEIFARAIDDPAAAGKVYELGGGKVYTYEELLDLVAMTLGKKKRKVHVPVRVMVPVVKLSKPLPRSLRPPVTEEQLRMLAIDSSTNRSATARLLGHPPRSLEEAIDYIAPVGAGAPPG